jgi:hypothetical protein
VVEHAPEAIRRLVDLGVPFNEGLARFISLAKAGIPIAGSSTSTTPPAMPCRKP